MRCSKHFLHVTSQVGCCVERVLPLVEKTFLVPSSPGQSLPHYRLYQHHQVIQCQGQGRFLSGLPRAALGSYCKAFEEHHLSHLCFLFPIRFNPEPLRETSSGVRNHLLALTSSWDAGEESFCTSVYINAKSLSWEAWVIPAGDWWKLRVILEFVFYKLVGGKKCQSISTFSRTKGLGKNKFGPPVKDLYPPLHLPWILSSRVVAMLRQMECKPCYHHVFVAFSK